MARLKDMYKNDVAPALMKKFGYKSVMQLPKIDKGDYLFIHDTGAHGYSMGYNYNGKLKSAELLLRKDGSVELIRRAETPRDYFATFDGLKVYDKLKEIMDSEGV